jgi:hypothetical protein
MLHDAIVFLRRAHHLPALPQEMRARFFHVNVFAGLASPNSQKRVPVIGSRYRDGIDGLVFHNAVRIGVDGGFRNIQALHVGEAVADDVLIDIADGGDFYVRQPGVLFNVLKTLAANADDRNANTIVSAEYFLRDEKRLAEGCNVGSRSRASGNIRFRRQTCLLNF